MSPRSLLTPSLLPFVVAACACFRGGAVGPPPPKPPASTPAETSTGPWSWFASREAAWRLPDRGTDLVLDGDHALVTTPRGLVMRVELGTGAVDPPRALVPAGSDLDSIVRVGHRVLGFGNHADGSPAAWAITTVPLQATALAIDDPVQEESGAFYDRAIASPDGRHVLVCDDKRWPTIRDARTLAAVWVLPGEKCFLPWWQDADRVVLGDHKARRAADLTRRVLRDVGPTEPQIHGGPSGHSVELDGIVLRYRDPGGHLLVEHPRGGGDLAWTPSGTAVFQNFGPLVVLDRDTGVARSHPMPDDLPRASALVADDRRAVSLFHGNAIVVVDLATGEVTRPPGNLDDARAIAPLGRTLVTVAERLRVFAPDGTYRDGPTSALDLVVGSTVAPIVALGILSLERVDPRTGAAESLGELDAILAHGARTSGGLAVLDSERVTLLEPGGVPRPWLQIVPSFEAVAITLDRRLLVKRNDEVHLVDVARDAVWSFQVSGVSSCEGSLAQSLEPAGRRLAVSAGDSVHLIDLVQRRPIASIAVDGFVRDVLAVGRDEVVMVTDTEVVLWQATAKRTLHWKHPIGREATALGTDGKALAIAFHGGAVGWISLDGLRARGLPRAVVPLETAHCTPLPALAVRDIVTEVP